VSDYTGNDGDNTFNGSNGDDTISGLDGEDNLSGGNGSDEIHGGDGDDVIYGGNAGDFLFGDAGNDEIYGQNGNDHLNGGAGDDLIDGNNGFDTAYYSGTIDEYSFFTSAGYLHILHLGGAGADGHDRLIRVERLVFADRVIELGSGHNAPVAVDDHVSIDEETGTYSSGAASVKDNDFDFDGDALTVTGGTFTGTYGTLTLNANGTYSYTLFASAQALAQGENVQDSFNYTLTDNDGSDTGALVFHIAGLNDAPTANPDGATADENETVLIDVLANDEDVDNGAILTVIAASAPSGQGTATVVGNQVEFDPGSDFEELAVGESEDVVISYDIEDEHGATSSSTVTVTVTGTNDGPVANPDAGSTSENATILVDVLANDTDVDNGAVLTVTAASAPAGQGTASVVGNQVEFDPGTDFDDLAVGESEVVVVSYDIEDEHGAIASSTITILVTGTNDGPVANPDTATTGENSSATIDVLANDTDVDNGAILVVTAASAPAGQGTATVVEDHVRFDPGTDFDYLAQGESAVVVVSYTITDEHGATSSSTVTITVQGRDEGALNTGTEDNDTLTGTSGDDTINALGGDDIVFGLAGDDLIDGGNGNDYLSGDDDNDTILGGNDDDVLTGGEGNDQLSGQAGNDNLLGDNGADQLSGGDGFDSLSGDAGDDVVQGGNDDDILSGGGGNDELLGQAGNDSLDDGDGDDALDGGGGNDFLTDFTGTNSFAGGTGDDVIVAGSSDGAQTIDAGDGNDTIRHYYRHNASTITTGTGSDTIELAHADQGTAAIIVTDFTPGAGGDVFQLSGADGSLLSLLSGWDGSSNPFGSGFLRLQQDGTDTLLEWDQDGAAGGANWETLVVFENTDADDFSEANFVPAYHPDGGAPAGQTITGTNDGETLTGTIGADTINALGGDDFVFGQAGADLIQGGDGFDFLHGEADDDVIDGGNDDDFLTGGDGNDQLLGQAGNDTLFGENGEDELSGGEGNDSLDGGDGGDTLDGGDGDDFVYGGLGSDVLSGGVGIDLFYLQSALDGPDEITDFVSGSDMIMVSASGFGGDLVPDGAVSLVSGSDPAASDATGQFLFDTDDGRLLWDADGTGSGDAVLIATFSNIPSLAATDFVVV
jgi:VCBS repeat-containing protein